AFIFPGLLVLKVIGAQKVIFRAGSGYGREFLVPIHKKLDFAFAPPSSVVYLPGHGGSHVVPLTLDAIDQGMYGALGWIAPSELGVEVCGVLGYLGQGVVHLIIQVHLLGTDVFHGYPTIFSKGHRPVRVERTARVYRYGQRIQGGILAPSHSEEIPYRNLNGWFFFPVPVKTQN